MIMPIMVLAFLGPGLVDPSNLIIIMTELILAPLIVPRFLIRIRMDSRLESIKGVITNWSFFLITYTIIGLNRELILAQPLFLLPVALIAMASTFLLEWVMRAWVNSLIFYRRHWSASSFLVPLKIMGLQVAWH